MRMISGWAAIRSLALLSVVALTSCATVTPQQQLETDRSHCRTLGFPEQSVPLAECVQRIELDRRADRRASQASMDRWMYDRPYYGRYWYSSGPYYRW